MTCKHSKRHKTIIRRGRKMDMKVVFSTLCYHISVPSTSLDVYYPPNPHPTPHLPISNLFLVPTLFNPYTPPLLYWSHDDDDCHHCTPPPTPPLLHTRMELAELASKRRDLYPISLTNPVQYMESIT